MRNNIESVNFFTENSKHAHVINSEIEGSDPKDVFGKKADKVHPTMAEAIAEHTPPGMRLSRKVSSMLDGAHKAGVDLGEVVRTGIEAVSVTAFNGDTLVAYDGPVKDYLDRLHEKAKFQLQRRNEAPRPHPAHEVAKAANQGMPGYGEPFILRDSFVRSGSIFEPRPNLNGRDLTPGVPQKLHAK